MKLILTHEVDGLGAPGDIVEVKDGYGRNYLMPRGFATRWTRGAEKQITTIRRVRDARRIRDAAGAAQIKTELEANAFPVSVRAGDAGRLFGAVTSADIVAAIVAAGGPTLSKRDITLADPIKTVGEHIVTVKLLGDEVATVVLAVTAG